MIRKKATVRPLIQNYFLVLILVVSGCLYPFSASRAAGDNREQVTLLLKWQHQFQFAGYYAAQEKGYYREAGLDVELRVVDLPGSPAQKMLRGEVEYIIADAGLFLYRAKGEPVVALAAIFQHSPYAFLVRADSGIESIQDFRGKRLMLGVQAEGAELQATLRRAGLTADDYTFVPLDFDFNKLIDGEIDVLSAYTTTQGFRLQELGIEPRHILPAFYGVDFYGDILATTESEIANHPARANAMIDASIRGWHYALDHPEEIVDLILEKYNTQGLSRQQLLYEAEASAELIQPLMVGIGYMNVDRWKHIRAVFEELELVIPDAEIEGFLYQRVTAPGSLTQWLKQYWIAMATALSLLAVSILLIVLLQTRRLVRLRTAQLSTSEEHLRDVINAVPACVATLDPDGRILTMNASGVEMFLAKESEILKGRFLRDFVNSEYISDFDHLIQEAEAGRPKSLIYQARDLEQNIKWLETYCVLLVDLQEAQAQTQTQILTVTQDLTEHKAEEEQHNELQRMVNQKHKMEALGQLSGGIAHDFNNILSIMLGHTELALKLEEDQETALSQRLFTILNAGRRAKDLVSNLLAFSRIDKTDEKPVELTPLVLDNVNMLKSMLPATIALNVNCQNDIPMVLIDQVHVQQLLFNLAINARDAMEDNGTLTVNLDWSRSLNDTCVLCHQQLHGDWLELAITDSGHGISPDELDHIFEPFYTTKAVGKGTGLGLSVIHGIMNREGRHVLVDTEFGKGTTFRLLFEPTKLPEITSNISASNKPEIYGRGQTIMVVDDEMSLANLVAEYLELHNYKTVVFSHSNKALAAFSDNPDSYNLVVTDQTMPGLTGTELIENIKYISPLTPVVLCSGIDTDMKQHAADEYLKKPFDLDELLTLVSRMLEDKEKLHTI